MIENSTITIPRKDYIELVQDRRLLLRLFAAGVDNWEVLEDCMEDEDEDDTYVPEHVIRPKHENE